MKDVITIAFSRKVREKALAACGRRCCLCQKFCGPNMEIHHIIQKADGGRDTYENALPLCFVCHADMGKTDPHHPKGRDYTAEELRIHRDRWYKLIETGIAFQELPKTTIEDEEKKDYLKRYRALRFEASCALDYYANVYTDIAEEKDERHEKASDDLRKMGVMLKAFSAEEQPEVSIDIPKPTDLQEVAGLFIGLSNSMYVHKGGDSWTYLDHNLKREEKIRELLKL